MEELSKNSPFETDINKVLDKMQDELDILKSKKVFLDFKFKRILEIFQEIKSSEAQLKIQTLSNNMELKTFSY